jgi:uncharacterized protein (TIGR03067 family)
MAARCWFGLSLVVGLILLSATSNPANGDNADPKKGEWVAVAGIHDGVAISKDQVSGIRLNWGEGMFVGGSKERPAVATITLCPPLIPRETMTVGGYTCYAVPKAAPKQFFFVQQIGFKSASYPAIYELKGDTLTVCCNLESWCGTTIRRAVPKEFGSPRKSGLSLLTFKKLKR